MNPKSVALTAIYGISLGLLSALATSCGDTEDNVPVVENPTFEAHVAPIHATYCNSCHSDPALQEAPDGFRLDICAGGDKPGAQAFATRSALRAADQPSNPMPPESFTPSSLSDGEKAILRQWAATGAPCTTADIGQ